MTRMRARRDFLMQSASGIGLAALGQLLGQDQLLAAADPLSPRAPHFAAKAKNLIFLFMEGAPSQMDLFDPKPALRKWHGQPLPPSMTKDLKLAFIKPTATVLGSDREFRKAGQAGIELSDALPHLAKVADELCLVRSMHSEAFNHHPGQLLLFSGSIQPGRPSMGAWVTYGLGSESKNLPGFVVLTSGVGTSAGADNFTSGFLPSHYSGSVFRSSGDPILYLSNPAGVTKEAQRAKLDAIRAMNELHGRQTLDPEIESRIQAYELAFRMQSSAPELLDFSNESQATRDLYGLDQKETRAYGTNCLLARRMVERGVRCVMLMHASWDHHSTINRGLMQQAKATDQPAAALVADLKQRGLLDSTLVVWAGEFGRTPMSEIRRPEEAGNAGRDHHPNGYSIWMAGGGVRAGTVVGSTDELGLQVAEDKVTTHDLQATILHLLGFDHKRLTYNYMGRDFRLTDVHGQVVSKILA